MNMMRMEFTYRRHVKGAVLQALITSVMWGLHLQAHCRNMPVDADLSVYVQQDITDTLKTDTLASERSLITPKVSPGKGDARTTMQQHRSDTLFVANLQKSPYISLQQ